MTETGISDYFIFDEQRGADDDRIPLVAPSAARVPDAVVAAADTAAEPTSVTPASPVAPASVVPPVAATAPVPVAGTPAPPAPSPSVTTPAVAAVPPSLVTPVAAPGREPAATSPGERAAATPPQPAAATLPAVAESHDTRPQRLHAALDDLIAGSPDIEAAAVISLDGFTMASALPASMQEDRVGAMSAAILALGERASRELGKGKLTQVFIEGECGYVMLMAAGSTAVLTCLASEEAKLGLVIYDMRRSVARVAEIVG